MGASNPDLEFHADRTAEMVDDEYVAVTQETFVDTAIEEFRAFEPESDETTVYYLYVTDNSGRLVGVMSLRELLNAPEDDVVEAHMSTDLITINADADPEYAASEMAERDFPALPVVDDDGVLVGVLRTDDMIEVVEEEATEDIMKSAGFSFADVETSRSSAILESSILKILRLRLPWLLVALAGGLTAGLVIEGFEETLEAIIVLGFFIPVIMDMGGNVGTQASTIFVRGLAVGHIDDRNAMRHFRREAGVGLTIGVIIGAIGSAAAYLYLMYVRGLEEPLATHGDVLSVSAVLFVSLAAVCTIASTVGYVVPWIAHKLGYDPAAVSDPLVTTVKDITALVIYFGMATLLLGHLV
ncbi:magnesium transporter [Natronorubrum daqingense]|uniref:Magnesium transporter MgtE n=1 Tax=Natronorubrum daqingense TaxID=588898 RepID=A0A1N7FQ49_9EURY|nr:magnesium transporter [Natronorubrum daqingense]APX97318.1 magnesium transporter [Natronorubrum daqingense]SIS02395.1 magnesium transporter [Natronorubrum daqingense]